MSEPLIYMLVRYQGAVYVGRPRLVQRAWPDGASTLTENVLVYDPCWVYRGNEAATPAHFNAMMLGEYPYNLTWTACPGLQLGAPDMSVPLIGGTPGYEAWALAVNPPRAAPPARCDIEISFHDGRGEHHVEPCNAKLPCLLHGGHAG